MRFKKDTATENPNWRADLPEKEFGTLHNYRTDSFVFPAATTEVPALCPTAQNNTKGPLSIIQSATSERGCYKSFISYSFLEPLHRRQIEPHNDGH